MYSRVAVRESLHNFLVLCNTMMTPTRSSGPCEITLPIQCTSRLKDRSDNANEDF